jgi:hypothetical protein
MGLLSNSGRLRRPITPFTGLLAGLMLVWAGCGSTPVKQTAPAAPVSPPSAVAASPEAPVSAPESASPPVVVEDPPGHDERPVDIWLIPVVGFPDSYTVDLIDRLKRDTGLHIRSSVEAGVSPSLFFPDSKQMNANQALREFSRIPASLGPAKSSTTYLFLTAYDINSADRRFRFLFSQNDVEHRRALISIARMKANPDGAGEAPALTKVRLYKMAKRQVGELYYRYSRSSDLNNVMYSPLMGLDDLDMIGTGF